MLEGATSAPTAELVPKIEIHILGSFGGYHIKNCILQYPGINHHAG